MRFVQTTVRRRHARGRVSLPHNSRIGDSEIHGEEGDSEIHGEDVLKNRVRLRVSCAYVS